MGTEEKNEKGLPWYSIIMRGVATLAGSVFAVVLAYRLAMLQVRDVTVTEAISVLLAVFSIALAVWLSWATHRLTVRFYRDVLNVIREMTGRMAGIEAQAGRLSLADVHSLLARFSEAQSLREQSGNQPEDPELKEKLRIAEERLRNAEKKIAAALRLTDLPNHRDPITSASLLSGLLDRYKNPSDEVVISGSGEPYSITGSGSGS